MRTWLTSFVQKEVRVKHASWHRKVFWLNTMSKLALFVKRKGWESSRLVGNLTTLSPPMPNLTHSAHEFMCQSWLTYVLQGSLVVSPLMCLCLCLCLCQLWPGGCQLNRATPAPSSASSAAMDSNDLWNCNCSLAAFLHNGQDVIFKETTLIEAHTDGNKSTNWSKCGRYQQWTRAICPQILSCPWPSAAVRRQQWLRFACATIHEYTSAIWGRFCCTFKHCKGCCPHLSILQHKRTQDVLLASLDMWHNWCMYLDGLSSVLWHVTHWCGR